MCARKSTVDLSCAISRARWSIVIRAHWAFGFWGQARRYLGDEGVDTGLYQSKAVRKQDVRALLGSNSVLSSPSSMLMFSLMFSHSGWVAILSQAGELVMEARWR